MFFEQSHSLTENEFTFIRRKCMNFPIHIHRSFEYIKQLSGCTEVQVGTRKYLLQSGDAVLSFPMQPHSYTCREDGEICMIIFSPDLVPAFYKPNILPTENKFHCALPDDLPSDTVFHKKAAAYFICGEFEIGRTYTERPVTQGEKLFLSLLLYADKNFHTPCLLRDAAEANGYDYAYVSKLFKSRAGMSFRQYINFLRINESKQLLRINEKSVEEISEACGFATMRSFDREFRTQTGMTPSQYRKSKRG